MNELELSVILATSDELAALERLDLDCQTHVMAWETAWAELMKVALYQHGPDVSQIGTSWVSNLAAMQGLRPFIQREIDTLGGAETFVSASWATSQVTGRGQGWAIPWLADVRVIFYWRDMLQQAGVDEQNAFQTPAHIEKTLDRLQINGVSDSPWIVLIQFPFVTLQNVASWVWGLVRQLLSKETQLEYCQGSGHLPVRLDVLNEPPYSTDLNYQVMVEALNVGRPFPTFRLWGLVEERLGATLNKVWGIILNDPSQDLEAVIAGQLEPLSRRLDETLSGMR